MWVWKTFWCVAVAVTLVTTASPQCDVIIDEDTYRKEIIIIDMRASHGMAVDYSNNVLYFSCRPKSTWFSAQVDLETGYAKILNELPAKCMFTVDQVRHYVHAGCEGGRDLQVNRVEGGLYQFDSHPGKFVLTGEQGKRVTFVHYDDALYYSVYSSYELTKFQRGHAIRVPGISSPVLGLVIDKHKNWIYQNSSEVYRQRPGTDANASRTELTFPSVLAVNTRGDVYACGASTKGFGIHRLPDNTSQAVLVLPLMFCTSFTFDRDDNIIYCDYDKIVRLIKC